MNGTAINGGQGQLKCDGYTGPVGVRQRQGKTELAFLTAAPPSLSPRDRLLAGGGTVADPFAKLLGRDVEYDGHMVQVLHVARGTDPRFVVLHVALP